MKIETIKQLVAMDPMALERILSAVYSSLPIEHPKYSMFDGGAHKGYHTLRMAALTGCVKVHAVEADPSMFDILSSKLATVIPEIKDRVVLHGAALQDSPYCFTVPWASSVSHVGRSSIVSDVGARRTIWDGNSEMIYREDVFVPATTIDILMEPETLPLVFLKLDLEGADLLSLRGATRTLGKARPIVAFENSIHAPKTHGFSIESIESYFSSLNYVALTYNGEKMDCGNWFSFHEAWVVPKERQVMFQQLLGSVLKGFL